jgi:hypothetical protein
MRVTSAASVAAAAAAGLAAGVAVFVALLLLTSREDLDSARRALACKASLCQKKTSMSLDVLKITYH